MGKRKGINGHKKGGSFEREVAKLFKEYLDIEFVRTPCSGGWGKAKTKGDLVCIGDASFPYFVECKKVEGWDLWNFITKDEGPIFEWWEKAILQAESEEKVPLLVFAQNRREPLLIHSIKHCSVESVLEHELRYPAQGIIIHRLETWLAAKRLQKNGGSRRPPIQKRNR